MDSYLLPNYQLSCIELLQSLVVSEYGLRHLSEANQRPERMWGHRLIALVEFIPVLGQLAMIVEWIVSQILRDPLDLSQRNEWLFRGSQNGCQGPAPQDRVLRVVEQIDRICPAGIYFNRNKAIGRVEGGACTAMAFDFADAFFKMRKVHVKTSPHLPDAFLNGIRGLGRQFESSSEQSRIRQAAFNTIEVRGVLAGTDIAKNKVQALANLHGFKVDHSSSEIAVNQMGSEQAVNAAVAGLPDGLYLLRTIKPINNERLEEHGHSMIYVKEQQEGFFYDPNYGVKYMKNVNQSPEIFNALAACYSQFETSRARFFRLA